MELTVRRVAGGVEFRVEGVVGSVPLAMWGSLEPPRLPTGKPARIGVLLRLLEDGQADVRDGVAVFIEYEVVARLDDIERSQIGLPRSAELTLELCASGGFYDPDFRIERRLLQPDGRPVVAPEREGCFMCIGGNEAVLPEPLYSLWEEVDHFNQQTRGLEARMLAWARIRERLPEGVRLDQNLDAIQVVLASGFSLSPFHNDHGEPDFDPVLGRLVELTTATGENEWEFREALPPARRREFARRFRAYHDVQQRYLGGSGVYIVLSERLRQVLRVVRQFQSADHAVRRRFLLCPSAFLRMELERQADAAGVFFDEREIDAVFFDEGLSERVREIGVWKPKALPWLPPSGEAWLPEEPVSLLANREPLRVPPARAAEVLEEVQRARAEGRELVEFDGVFLPATEETERALQRLVPVTGEERSATSESEKLALLIFDNLEEVGFRLKRRGVRGSAGRVPHNLGTPLLPHQRRGLRWLQEHWVEGSPGALLADDMGLGKTLQALAFVTWVQDEMREGRWPRRPLLVVAPTGLLQNWRAEHDKHLSGDGLGRVIEAFGSGLRLLRTVESHGERELASGLPLLDIVALTRADWVLTTYETLRDYQHSFGRVHWAVVVFDEAQKLKNPAAGLTEAAKAMKADFTVVMTGTPVENRVEDLWSILDAARPGELGSLKDFSARFRNRGGPENHWELQALRDHLSVHSSPPIMLRRLKEDHLEGLPDKQIHVYDAEMPERQASTYRAAVRTAQRERMLQVLQQLRSISLHPAPAEIVGDGAFIAESARLTLAFQILDEIRVRREKALIFLESRTVQDALAEILPRRYRLSQRVLIINGEISGTSRKARVDEFQGRPGFDVMILSPRAGGVGLTLTAANHVVHLARWWNPAVEDQCTDRVYRIGQEKTVHVYHLLALHPDFRDRSFDVRLAALLQRKRGLHRSLLVPAAPTAADLEELYQATVGI